MKTLDEALAESTITNYPTAFQTAMAFILPHETEFQTTIEDGKKVHHYGDYDYVRTENVPGDNGGQTRYGIDRASHPGVDINSLDLAAALEIYWNEWQQHECDLLPDKLAVAAFDVWVNGGHADQWLQHAANEAGANLKEDGKLGPASLAAIKGADEDNLLASFLAQRQARFERLAQQAHNAQFLDGWTARNNDLAALLA